MRGRISASGFCGWLWRRCLRRSGSGSKRKAAADALKPVILAIVQPRGQVARRGALVSLDKSYAYSAAVAVLSKTLSDTRATERDTGLAKAVVTETVSFEDVRRRDAAKRAKMAV